MTVISVTTRLDVLGILLSIFKREEKLQPRLNSVGFVMIQNISITNQLIASTEMKTVMLEEVRKQDLLAQFKGVNYICGFVLSTVMGTEKHWKSLRRKLKISMASSLVG